MLKIANKQELINQRRKIHKGIKNAVENDAIIIEESYKEYIEKPVIFIINTKEEAFLKEIIQAMFHIKSEGEIVIYSDEKIVISRDCYLIGEGGIITYTERKKGKNV